MNTGKKQLKDILSYSHENTVPSLRRNSLEGVTTRIYNLSRFFYGEKTIGNEIRTT